MNLSYFFLFLKGLARTLMAESVSGLFFKSFEIHTRITFPPFFSTDTLANVEDNWIKEVRHYCRKVPIILVGNKIDIRTDPQVMKELASNNKVSKNSTYKA
jgi:hypothetical protein